jgi:hypothetical protein
MSQFRPIFLYVSGSRPRPRVPNPGPSRWRRLLVTILLALCSNLASSAAGIQVRLAASVTATNRVRATVEPIPHSIVSRWFAHGASGQISDRRHEGALT